MAVCVGETVVKVSSMPRKRRGATTYSSLQSDRQRPWRAPWRGTDTFTVLVVVLLLTRGSAAGDTSRGSVRVFTPEGVAFV